MGDPLSVLQPVCKCFICISSSYTYKDVQDWIGMASLQALQYLNVSFVATILSVPSCPIEAVGESMKSFEQRRWWNDYEGEDNNDNGDDGDDEGNDKEERGWAEGGSWHGSSLLCESWIQVAKGCLSFLRWSKVQWPSWWKLALLLQVSLGTSLFFGYSDQPYEVSCDGCTNSPVWNFNKTMNF